MPEKPKNGHCIICTLYCNALNWHHTVPQALGGSQSLQIPLCPTCHDTLHAHAEAVVARMRGKKNKKVTRCFWRTAEAEYNAKPYLEILIHSIINPPVSAEDKETKVIAKLDYDLHRGLQLLKIDESLGNLEAAIKYCIAFTLNNKGIGNGNFKRTQKERKNLKGPKASLW